MLGADDLDLLYETSSFASRALKLGGAPGETVLVRDLSGEPRGLRASVAWCERTTPIGLSREREEEAQAQVDPTQNALCYPTKHILGASENNTSLRGDLQLAKSKGGLGVHQQHKSTQCWTENGTFCQWLMFLLLSRNVVNFPFIGSMA